MRTIDVLVVGSGPAGMSTALHLIKRDPGWSRRMIVLDKAVHPRVKLCGGGISRFGANMLANLGLTFEPPHVAVNELRILAKVVVAADGASSLVKRKLEWGGASQTARLLEILTPEVAEDRFEFREGVAVFDFTPMLKGLQGYYWDFPCLIKGQPYMNRGVFDSRVRPDMPRIPLKEEFEPQLSQRGHQLSQYQLKGHPIHWFDATADFARPRVLLVGDAAGIDPFFGEGIPFALGYGEAAAFEIGNAFAEGCFGFATYRERILKHPLLKQLRLRTSSARLLYTLPKYPLLLRVLCQFAPVMFSCFAWYRPQYIPAERPRMLRR